MTTDKLLNSRVVWPATARARSPRHSREWLLAVASNQKRPVRLRGDGPRQLLPGTNSSLGGGGAAVSRRRIGLLCTAPAGSCLLPRLNALWRHGQVQGDRCRLLGKRSDASSTVQVPLAVDIPRYNCALAVQCSNLLDARGDAAIHLKAMRSPSSTRRLVALLLYLLLAAG